MRLFLASTLCFSLCATTWDALLTEYKIVIGEDTHQLLTRQYEAFITNSAPPIADKRITCIPITECHEPLVDLYEVHHARIRVMEESSLGKAHACPEDIDPRSDKHGCLREGVFVALTRMIHELDVLAPSFGYEAGELEIHLFEGLRDLSTQKHLFDTLMNSIQQANSQMSREEAYAETARWVSPYIDNVPVHSTGGAIDIMLWSNKSHSYCTMGRFNSSKDGAPTFSEDGKLLDRYKLNRLLMLAAATRAGLTNYVYEFWHFSYGDRYASYWRVANPPMRSACYNSV